MDNRAFENSNYLYLNNLLEKTKNEELSHQEEKILANEMFRVAQERLSDDCERNEWTAVKRLMAYYRHVRESGVDMSSMEIEERIVNFFYRQQVALNNEIKDISRNNPDIPQTHYDNDGMNFMARPERGNYPFES
jgi:hypothetical protein